MVREIRRNERAKKLGKGTKHINKDKFVVEVDSRDENIDSGDETGYFNSSDNNSYSEESDGEGGKVTLRKKEKMA